jgi:ribosomal protein S17
MFILYIVENVDDSLNKLKIVSIYQYKPIVFDRLERILSSLGFKYYTDYSSVSVYKNTKEYKIGDIIELSSTNDDTIFYKTYCSDISLGDYSNNMLIKLIK